MPFFLTIPTSMNRPNIAYRSIGVRHKMSHSIPKGMVTGRAMRMAIGCIQLSNWAARIRGGPGDIALALDGATAFCLADGGEDVLGCLQLPDSVFQLAHQPGAPVEAVALRRCDRDFILALVVARDQRHAHDLADRHGAADDRDGQHDDQELESQSASQDPAVAAVEETVDEPRLRSRLMAVAGFARFQL